MTPSGHAGGRQEKNISPTETPILGSHITLTGAVPRGLTLSSSSGSEFQ